jgi:hypothetical protein
MLHFFNQLIVYTIWKLAFSKLTKITPKNKFPCYKSLPMLTHPRDPSFWFFAYKLFSSWIWLKYCFNRAGYNNVCELIDWLLKVQQAIFQSYSGWEKFVSKKSERKGRGTLVRSSFCLFLFFVYSFISSFFSIVTFLGWTRLHATWIKPEVVATKKYTCWMVCLLQSSRDAKQHARGSYCISTSSRKRGRKLI